jgi:hypothetical protein
MSPSAAKTVEELVSAGYCRTSNRFGLVSRIDRADWKEYMAKRHSPWSKEDGLRWVAALGHAGAEDHYRRIYSTDTVTVGQALGKHFPASSSTVTGFKPLKEKL